MVQKYFEETLLPKIFVTELSFAHLIFIRLWCDESQLAERVNELFCISEMSNVRHETGELTRDQVHSCFTFDI